MNIVGHRGARGEAPENTLAAFEWASRNGTGEMELDLRLSRDHQLMVVHDRELERTTWHSGPVDHYTGAELNAMDARRTCPDWPKPATIPNLPQVLDSCPADTRFQLEVKPSHRRGRDLLAQGLQQLIDQRGLEPRVVVTSSDLAFLKRMRRQAPHCPLGVITQQRLARALRQARRLNADWLMVHRQLLHEQSVAAARRAGLRLSVWTVNDPATARECRALGVDSLITDYPAGLTGF